MVAQNDAIKEKILQYDRPVPRYTSYPTAPHFQAGTGDQDYEKWLAAIPLSETLSLYLHVPFCQKLCWYCGCHTKITQRYAPVEDYAHLLLREIAILKDLLGSNRPVSQIHFGGGSPGMLRAQDFELIMNSLLKTFNIGKQTDIAIELDPRGITEGRVAIYAKSGVTRISLGVQDFDEQVLKAVNRQQPFLLSYDAVSLLRSYGIHALNLDLLYGLPHQNPQTMESTIDKALLLDPDRISLFGYAHVPWVKKHMKLIDEQALPDKEMRYDLFQIGSTKLKQAGYETIGIDHFAKGNDALVKASKAGKLRRNFQGYTDDTAKVLIGMGASAIGKMEQGFVQNAVDMPTYKNAVLGGRLPVRKYCALSAEDRLRSAVIEALMCNFTANVPHLCSLHGFDRNYLQTELESLDQWQKDGFVTLSPEGVIDIDKQASAITRLVASIFDTYLMHSDASTPRHARAI